MEHDQGRIPRQLDSCDLLDFILLALANRQALSVVSIGQTEAFVMAQYSIYSEEQFMNHREAYNANLGVKTGFLHRGIRFPNIEARDAVVEAARLAGIIGYNLIEPWAREFTDKVFQTYGIHPGYYFEANIRRVFMFSQLEKFASLLSKRRVLLVGSLAPEAREALTRKHTKRLGLDVVGAVTIYDYEEIPRVKKEIARHDFDLCLLGAGVNAVILSVFIAQELGKVAFDIGWGMKSLISGEVVTDSFIDEVIGLDNLMRM